MVQKEDEESYGTMPSTITVATTVESSSNTIGAAIDILEAKLAKKGIIIQCPASKPDSGKVTGKLLRLSTLIELGITHAIDSTCEANDSSIGVVSKIDKALVPGNIVAVNMTGYDVFLSMSDENVRHVGGAIDSLPFSLDSARFLIVDACDGNIAFYSPSHRRFLGCKNGILTAAGFPITNANEGPRGNERFKVTKTKSIVAEKSFCLYCPIEKKDARLMSGEGIFEVVKVYGFD